MYGKQKISRNDPCPCGSGKKYKKCCGAGTDEPLASGQAPDYFMVNREIAYKGRIGRQREDFCISYIGRKKKRFEELQHAQLKVATAIGDTISCQKGCSFCCCMYIEATLQECEAIVYYLYQNEDVLTAFLRRYPRWREKVRKSGDLFESYGRVWNQGVAPENAPETQQALNEKQERYLKQNILCPFLDNRLCSIYEVRPFMCLAHHAVSPPEWCNPQSPNEPIIRKAIPAEVRADRSFYYRNLDRFTISCAPIAVYEILKNGTYYFSASDLPALQNLDYEFCNDPEVVAILRRYGAGGQ